VEVSEDNHDFFASVSGWFTPGAASDGVENGDINGTCSGFCVVSVAGVTGVNAGIDESLGVSIIGVDWGSLTVSGVNTGIDGIHESCGVSVVGLDWGSLTVSGVNVGIDCIHESFGESVVVSVVVDSETPVESGVNIGIEGICETFCVSGVVVSSELVVSGVSVEDKLDINESLAFSDGFVFGFELDDTIFEPSGVLK